MDKQLLTEQIEKLLEELDINNLPTNISILNKETWNYVKGDYGYPKYKYGFSYILCIEIDNKKYITDIDGSGNKKCEEILGGGGIIYYYQDNFNSLYDLTEI